MKIIELQHLAKKWHDEKEAGFGYITELDFKNAGIPFDVVKLPYNEYALYVEVEEGLSVTYGKRYSPEQGIKYNRHIRMVKGEDLEKINRRYHEVHYEYHVLQKVYESQKIRGMFEKLKMEGK